MQLQSIKGYNAASWGPDITVHIITQRYAELTTSLLLLNADYQACPPHTLIFCSSSFACKCVAPRQLRNMQ